MNRGEFFTKLGELLSEAGAEIKAGSLDQELCPVITLADGTTCYATTGSLTPQSCADLANTMNVSDVTRTATLEHIGTLIEQLSKSTGQEWTCTSTADIINVSANGEQVLRSTDHTDVALYLSGVLMGIGVRELDLAAKSSC